MSDHDAQLLGRLAVHFKLISPQQAAAAAKAQSQPGEQRMFGELLVALHFINTEQLKWLLDAQAKYRAKQAGAPGAPAAGPGPVQVMAPGPVQVMAPSPGPVQVMAPSPGPVQVMAPGPVQVTAPGPRPVQVTAPGPVQVMAPSPGPVQVMAPSPGPVQVTAGPVQVLAPVLAQSPAPVLAQSPVPMLAQSPAPVLAQSPVPVLAQSPAAPARSPALVPAPAQVRPASPPAAPNAAARAPAPAAQPAPAGAGHNAASPNAAARPASVRGSGVQILPVAPAAPPREPEPPPEPTTAHRAMVTPPRAENPEQQALYDALVRAINSGASDLHLHAAATPQLRIGGMLKNDGIEKLSREQTERMLLAALTPEQREYLEKHKEIDFSYVIPGVSRFRANIYRQQRGLDGVFRPISNTPPTLEQLGLPAMLSKLTDYPQGLVLLTGPAGCGKSSTQAALVDIVNGQRDDHIITVEDPIEYIHKSKRCVVNQRQAGKHTATFASALRAALREDPDIIVIGELRDLETISLAISAAETGHLVFGTLHTNSTIRTINRILDAFPPKQQPQIRSMVSESLRAVISQRLVPTVDGTRRVPALEVLFVKPAISNLIRDQKTFQIRSILQTARSEGMCLMDDSLLDLVKAGTITKEAARKHAEDLKRFA